MELPIPGLTVSPSRNHYSTKPFNVSAMSFGLDSI
jgi:hypothetical protein